MNGGNGTTEEPTFRYKVSGGGTGGGGRTTNLSDWKSDSSDDGGLGDSTDDGGSISKSNNDTTDKANKLKDMTPEEIEAFRKSEQARRRRERKRNRELRKQRGERNKSTGDIDDRNQTVEKVTTTNATDPPTTSMKRATSEAITETERRHATSSEIIKSPSSPRRRRVSSGVMPGLDEAVSPAGSNGGRRRPSSTNMKRLSSGESDDTPISPGGDNARTRRSSTTTKRLSSSAPPNDIENVATDQQQRDVEDSPRRRNKRGSGGRKIASPGSYKREVFISPLDTTHTKEGKKGSLLAKYLPPVSSLEDGPGSGGNKNTIARTGGASMIPDQLYQQQRLGKTSDHLDAESVNTLGSVPRVVTISPPDAKGKSGEDSTAVSQLTKQLPRILQDVANDGASTIASDIYSTTASHMINGKKDGGRRVLPPTKSSDASMDDSILSEEVDETRIAVPATNDTTNKSMGEMSATSTTPGEPTQQQQQMGPSLTLGHGSPTITSLQRKLEQLERDYRAREKQLMLDLSKAQEESSNTKKDVDEAASRVKNLESIVERLRKQNKELVDTHEVEVTSISKDVEDKSKELEGALQQVQTMENKVNVLKKENEELLLQKTSGDHGVDGIANDSTIYKIELEQSRQTIKDLQIELAELKALSTTSTNGDDGSNLTTVISLSKADLDNAFEDGISAKKAFMAAQQLIEAEKGMTKHAQLTAATLRDIDARRRQRESVHVAAIEKLKEDHKAREYLLGRTLVFYRAEGEQAKKGVEEAKHCVTLYQKVIQELQGGIKELTNRRNEENSGIRIQLSLIQQDLSNFAATLSEDVEVPTRAQGVFVNALRKIKMLQNVLDVGPDQNHEEAEYEEAEHEEDVDAGNDETEAGDEEDDSTDDEEDEEIDEEEEED